MWKQHRINGPCVCSRGLICVCLHFIYLSYNLFLCYANTGWVKPCIISPANTHTCSSWLLENKEIITFIVSGGGKCCSSTAGKRKKNLNNPLHSQMMSHGVKSSLIHSLCKCSFLFFSFFKRCPKCTDWRFNPAVIQKKKWGIMTSMSNIFFSTFLLRNAQLCSVSWPLNCLHHV